jgi:hypothetical protein
MNDYAYQIQGALESASGKFRGLRVLVCDLHNFESVDIPVEVFDTETVKFLEYRLKLTEVININRLPIPIQNKIRAPLGRWLDFWVLEHFYGNTGKPKSFNS